MHKFLLILLFTVPHFLSAQSNDFLAFESEQIHLGVVTKGEKVDSSFQFTNISNEDVVIELVSTCECTKADWPKSVIKPGETGKIPFIFDSNEKDKEEEISIDVYLKNIDKDGNPVIIFLYYDYQY